MSHDGTAAFGGPQQHRAHFYTDEAELVATIGAFALVGLAGGEPVVIVARERRLAALRREFADIARTEQAEDGRATLLDAERLLAVLMPDGRVDPAAFSEHVSSLLDRVRRVTGGARLQVYGEMVDVLVDNRQYAAAEALESLWNVELSRAPAHLLCGYHLDAFPGTVGADALDRVCGQHGTIDIGDSPREERPDVSRLRAVHRDREQSRLTTALIDAHRRMEVALLAAGVAHDLNNLLSPITLAAEDLLEHSPTDEVREAAEMILSGAQRSAELVRALVRASRPSTGRRPVAVQKIVSEVVTLLKSQLTHVRVRLEFDADVPPVLAHESAMVQVVLNLLKNAREAVGELGGHITVRVARDTAPHGPTREWTRLSVIDNGCGMSAVTLAHLFEPFYSTKHDGHGIGLAAVQHLVTAMGGLLDVVSHEGTGTTFSVWMPALPSTAVTPLPTAT
jgi:signal transduction histidine kinase